MEVVEPGAVLRIVRFLQFRGVARAVQDVPDHRAQIGDLQGGSVGRLHDMAGQILAQTVHELQEPGDGVASPGTQARNLAGRRGTQTTGEAEVHVLGVHADLRNRPVADTAARGVDDAAQAHRVLGVVEDLEVCHHIPDLPSFVEPRTTDDLVGQARTHEHILDHARGVVRPVHHRDIAVGGVPVVDELVDGLGDEPGLVMLVVGDVTADQRAVTRIRPQLLLAAPLVPGDDGVRRREDVLGGAVVLFQKDRLGMRVVALELLDIPDRRTTEGVDRLVRVTDHAQFAGTRPLPHERGNQHVLGVVGVLVLVDEHMAEPAAVMVCHRRVGLQHPDDLADEIVEVHGVRFTQPRLVVAVDQGDLLAVPVAVLLRLLQHLGRPLQFVLPVGDDAEHRARSELLEVAVVVLEHHGDQTLLVIRVIDGEIGVQPLDELSIRPKDTDTQGVEGGQPHPLGDRADQIGDTFAHLRGGLVGEGDRQNLPGRDTVGEQPRHPSGEHTGLAGTGAGDDEQRGTVVDHGGTLGRVQPGKQLLFTGCQPVATPGAQGRRSGRPLRRGRCTGTPRGHVRGLRLRRQFGQWGEVGDRDSEVRRETVEQVTGVVRGQVLLRRGVPSCVLPGLVRKGVLRERDLPVEGVVGHALVHCAVLLVSCISRPCVRVLSTLQPVRT